MLTDGIIFWFPCSKLFTTLIGGDLAPSLGGRKIFSLTKNFLMTFFRKNFPFLRPKFLMTFFSHRSHFSDFPCLYCVSNVLGECLYWLIVSNSLGLREIKPR